MLLVKRFRLRSLLIAITCIALLLGTYQFVRERMRYQRIEEIASDNVYKCFDQLREPTPTVPASYGSFAFGSDSFLFGSEDYEYSLSRYRYQTFEEREQGLPVPLPEREGCIFVRPPGEWARTPEEALQLLKDHL